VTESRAKEPCIAVVMSRFPAVTETFILRELVELEAQGARVTLLPLLHDDVSVLHPDAEPWDARALYTPFLDTRILAANVRVAMLAPALYFRTLRAVLWAHRTSANGLVGALGIFPKAIWAGRVLRARGVQHVHAHYATHPATAAHVISTVKLRSEADLPYSVTVHAHDIFVSQAGLGLKLGAARFVRCISRFNAEFLSDPARTQGVRLERSRLPVIHCGIRPERYRHAPADGRPGRDREARLLCIASHRPYKGLPVLIDAVAKLRARGRRVVCDVIGEGVMRPQLERRIQDLGLGAALRLVGTRTEPQVVDELAAADVFVLPSIVAPDGQMEGIPIVLMEALAAGVPTIASGLSGIPELVVDGETGIGVPPGDAESLAAAIERVLDDYAGALLRAQNGALRVRQEFSLHTNVARLLARLSAEIGGTPAAVTGARPAPAGPGA